MCPCKGLTHPHEERDISTSKVRERFGTLVMFFALSGSRPVLHPPTKDGERYWLNSPTAILSRRPIGCRPFCPFHPLRRCNRNHFFLFHCRCPCLPTAFRSRHPHSIQRRTTQASRHFPRKKSGYQQLDSSVIPPAARPIERFGFLPNVFY